MIRQFLNTAGLEMVPNGARKFHSLEDSPFLSILVAKNRFQSTRLSLFAQGPTDQEGTLFRIILKNKIINFDQSDATNYSLFRNESILESKSLALPIAFEFPQGQFRHKSL